MPSSRPFPAFYQPPGPPPTIPLLLGQTELAPRPTSITLLSMLELPTSRMRADTPLAQRTRTSSKRAAPYNKDAPKDAPKTRSRTAAEREGTPTPSELSDVSTDVEVEVEPVPVFTEVFEGKIPKPDGENHRPGHGGYNLEIELRWSKKEYSVFKKACKAAIKKHLDMRWCYIKQAEPKLLAVKEEMLKQSGFPSLSLYEGEWPLEDFIKAHLKYVASRFWQANSAEHTGAGSGNGSGSGSA